MIVGILGGVFGVAGVVASIIFGTIAYRRYQNQDIASDATMEATFKANIDYIKRGVDEIKTEQSKMAENIGRLSERVTRVEESVKSAHCRLDEHLIAHPPKTIKNPCDEK